MTQNPEKLLERAKQAAIGAGGFRSRLFGGRVDEYETAANLYIQAANEFRSQNQTKEAGQAFECAAEIQKENLSEDDDAANTLFEAFKVYSTTDHEDAVRVIDVVVKHNIKRGKFRRAAIHKQSQAEVYEKMEDIESAIEAYKVAASWFESDNAKALANKLFLQSANLIALKWEDKRKAIEYFEKVAITSLSDNLMKWSVKEFFLKAGICWLAMGDMIGTEKALDRYRQMDCMFRNSLEYKLLVNLIEAKKTDDVRAFENKLYEYSQISELDNWKLTILNGIKKNFGAEDFS